MSDQIKKIQVGDIMVGTWGHEQVNVDFYKVVKRTAKFVTMAKIESVITPHERLSMQGSAMPDLESQPSKETLRRKVDRNMDGTQEMTGMFKWGGFIRIWDGKPQRVSWYA